MSLSLKRRWVGATHPEVYPADAATATAAKIGKTMLPIVRLAIPRLVECWLLSPVGDKLAVVVEPVCRVGG